jgi:hypothetical protein
MRKAAADGSLTKNLDSPTKDSGNDSGAKRRNVYNDFRKDSRIRAALRNLDGRLKDQNKVVAAWYKRWKQLDCDWDRLTEAQLAPQGEAIGYCTLSLSQT